VLLTVAIGLVIAFVVLTALLVPVIYVAAIVMSNRRH
jgi:hypothetical protein